MNWKTKVYQDYQDKIYGFILYHIKVGEVARDLTHDVFARLYASYDLDEISNVDSVIWTITRNRIVDHHRKVAHSRQYRDYLWTQISSANPVMDHIEFEETDALVREALKNLTPQQSKIYNLVREHDLSYREIGQELQLSTNTVKNHMVGALRSIRNYLKEHQEHITIWIITIQAVLSLFSGL